MKARVRGAGCQVSGRAQSSHVTHHAPRTTIRARAFSLMEVMIAVGIFFIALFSILGLVSQMLRNARAIQMKKGVDCGMVASQTSNTNKLTEEMRSGDFDDLYRSYEWTTDTYEVNSNGLFQVDMVVQRGSGNAPVDSKMSIILYRPESPPGRVSKGGGGIGK